MPHPRREYDFDGDAEWRAHLSRVEIPAAAPAAALLKVKAKWWKREKDPGFDVDAALRGAAEGAAAGGPRLPTSTSSSQPPPGAQPRQQQHDARPQQQQRQQQQQQAPPPRPGGGGGWAGAASGAGAQPLFYMNAGVRRPGTGGHGSGLKGSHRRPPPPAASHPWRPAPCAAAAPARSSCCRCCSSCHCCRRLCRRARTAWPWCSR
jgi:hypothetical protein